MAQDRPAPEGCGEEERGLVFFLSYILPVLLGDEQCPEQWPK